MKLILNGRETEVSERRTLLELLKDKGIEPDKVVVEYNSDIAKKEDWGNIVLKENDRLEVLKFVGGG